MPLRWEKKNAFRALNSVVDKSGPCSSCINSLPHSVPRKRMNREPSESHHLFVGSFTVVHVNCLALALPLLDRFLRRGATKLLFDDLRGHEKNSGNTKDGDSFHPQHTSQGEVKLLFGLHRVVVSTITDRSAYTRAPRAHTTAPGITWLERVGMSGHLRWKACNRHFSQAKTSLGRFEASVHALQAISATKTEDLRHVSRKKCSHAT